jgi:hypothetical protein
VVRVSDALDVVVALAYTPPEHQDWMDAAEYEGWLLASLDKGPDTDVVDELFSHIDLSELVDTSLAIQREDSRKLLDKDSDAVLCALRHGFSAVRLPDTLSGPDSKYYRWYVVLPIPDKSTNPVEREQVLRLRDGLSRLLRGPSSLPAGFTMPVGFTITLVHP